MTSPLQELLEALNQPWRQHAACRGMNPELFYPQKWEPADAALAVCAHCAVQADCRADAVARREPFGIWGGQRERARRRDVRERPLAFCRGCGEPFDTLGVEQRRYCDSCRQARSSRTA